MSPRRQFIVGLILSTFIAGFFAVFLCLWRVVPHWSIGQWSLRTQYALMPASALDGLLRNYHRVLDNGHCNALHPFLIRRLHDPGLSMEERDAIMRFYSRRVPRSRARPELFTLGPEWIGTVLDATIAAEAEVRHGAVFLMEGLYRQREIYKPTLHAEPEGSAQDLSKDEVAERAYLAFQLWWSLPMGERARRAPLDGTGLAIGEP
jgi:hypothetical protein